MAGASRNRILNTVINARFMHSSLCLFSCVARIETEHGQKQYKTRCGSFKPEECKPRNYLSFGLLLLVHIAADTAVPTAPPNFFSKRSDSPSCSV